MSGDVLKVDEILRDLENGGVNPEPQVFESQANPSSHEILPPPFPPPPPPSPPSEPPFYSTVNDNNSDIELGRTFYCQICMENNDASLGFKLSQCQHVFCKDCISNYLKSKIVDGQVYPKCFFISKTPVPEKEGEFEDEACDKQIEVADIESLFQEDSATLQKYQRYLFAKENKTARECPNCSHVQLGTPETTPVMICSQCQLKYCYFHATAHNFDRYPTCEEYEASIAKESKSTVDFIQSNSKPCPGCGVHVMKTGGCNHMKCQCGVAFCWLCGKQIDDATFPAHFQWWNPAGCANLQMNEAIEPSMTARCLARLLAFGQLVVLGPLTLLSTILSSTLCCCCIYMKFKSDARPMTFSALQDVFSTCMSSWGLVWMFLLFILPLGIALGAAAGSLVVGVAAMVFPCYASYRIARNEYPWPDSVTHCFRRCFRRLRHSRCLRGCGNLVGWCFRRMFGPCIRSGSNEASNQNGTPTVASPSHPNSVRFFRPSLNANSESVNSSPDKPISRQPSRDSRRISMSNTLQEENDVLSQMTLLLDLMERVEQLQTEQRKKKENAAASEVATPLNGDKLIGENAEDEMDLEYEEHRIRLQMLIEQMCNMNSAPNDSKNEKEESSRASNTENRETSNGFEVGVSVSVNYRGRGKYFPGKIVKRHPDGSCDIRYDDGESELQVTETFMRLSTPNVEETKDLLKINVGAKVEVNYHGRGKYFPGRVRRENRDGTFDIDFDDGDFENTVPSGRIRLVSVNGKEMASEVPISSEGVIEEVTVAEVASIDDIAIVEKSNTTITAPSSN